MAETNIEGQKFSSGLLPASCNDSAASKAPGPGRLPNPDFKPAPEQQEVGSKRRRKKASRLAS